MSISLVYTDNKASTGAQTVRSPAWGIVNGAVWIVLQHAAADFLSGSALAVMTGQGFSRIITSGGTATSKVEVYVRYGVPTGVDTDWNIPDTGDHTIASLFQLESSIGLPLDTVAAISPSQFNLGASGTFIFTEAPWITVSNSTFIHGMINNVDLASTTAYSNPLPGNAGFVDLLINYNSDVGIGGGIMALIGSKSSTGSWNSNPPRVDYSLGASHNAVPWFLEIVEVPAPTITSANNVPNAIGTQLNHTLTANQTVTWSIIGGTDQALFEISGSTLRWLGNGVSGSTGSKMVTVRATNTTGATTDQAITVPVYIPFTGPTYGGGLAAGASSAATFNINVTTIRGLGRRLFLGVMTANQTMAAPSGWTEYVPDSGSPFRGTAGAAGGVRLYIFWRDSDNTEANVAIPDSGDIQYAWGFYVAPASGQTLEFGPSIAGNVAATTAGSFTGLTTPSDDHLVIAFVASDRDAAAANWTPLTYGNLSNGAERWDNGTNTGTGGGIAVFTGEKQAAGATGNITATHAASAAYVFATLTLRHVATAPAATPYSFGFIA